jgi:hypothetical protein
MLLSFGLLVWPESITVEVGAPVLWWSGPAAEAALPVLFTGYAAALLALGSYTSSHAWHSRVLLHALDALWAIAFWTSGGATTATFGIVAAFAILAAGLRAGLYAAAVTTGAILLPLMVDLAFVPFAGSAVQGDGLSRAMPDAAAWFPQWLLLVLVLGLSYPLARQRRAEAGSDRQSRECRDAPDQRSAAGDLHRGRRGDRAGARVGRSAGRRNGHRAPSGGRRGALPTCSPWTPTAGISSACRGRETASISSRSTLRAGERGTRCVTPTCCNAGP